MGKAPAGVDPQVVAALTKYFQGYKSGTDFGFLAEVCRPQLDQFLLLKDTTVEAVQKTARAFFKGKDEISYVPDLGALWVVTRPDEMTARLPVEMKWAYPLPDEIKTNNTPPAPVGANVYRDVTVDVEVTLDSAHLITRYVETHVHMPALRETAEPNCREEAAHPKLRIVYDLGETYVSEMRARGEDVMRHVRTSEGDTWELESTGFAVSANRPKDCEGLDAEQDMAACLSATAAAESRCLVPYGDAGR
jgi:hypothetical protein